MSATFCRTFSGGFATLNPPAIHIAMRLSRAYARIHVPIVPAGYSYRLTAFTCLRTYLVMLNS